MKSTKGLWLIVSMILLAAFSRLIPHPLNFAPIGAIGLFGAAYFSKRWMAYMVPLAGMFVSDLVLNNLVYANWYPENYQNFIWAANFEVYAAFAVIILMGSSLLKKVTFGRVLAGSFAASLLFFLITNFAVWAGNATAYPNNFGGLLLCFEAGLPFFKNTVLGDLVYCGVLFGIFETVKATRPQWAFVR